MRTILNIQAAVKRPNYLIWNTEKRLPELYRSQKLKLVWKALLG